MKQYKVLQLGNPLLRVISAPIVNAEYGSSQLKKLANDLFTTMPMENGIGLAAPQIGINKRVVVFGMDERQVNTQLISIPYTILFNPSYVPTEDTLIEDYEGCLSVGKLRGKVLRYKSICYRGYDVDGHLIEREVSDLHARVVQHEIDHLDGVIFLDKVTNFSSLGFHDELIQSGALISNKTD